MAPRVVYRMLIVMLLLGTSLLGGSGSVQAKAPARAALARITSISGSGTGYVRVRLARPATLEQPWGSNREPVKVRAAGAFTGFALIEEVPGFDGVTLVGGRFTSGLPAYVIGDGGRLSESADGFRIPPGNYRLYLVTDQRSARVTLELGGLTGKTSLSPTTRVGSEIVSPVPSVDAAGRREVFWAGEEVRLDGPGLGFDVLWHTQPVHVDTEYWFCSYQEVPEGPAPYAPGCPSTSDRAIVHLGYGEVWLEPSGGLIAGLGTPLPEGTYGWGASYVAAQPITDSRYTQVWIAFDAGDRVSIEAAQVASGPGPAFARGALVSRFGLIPPTRPRFWSQAVDRADRI